MMLFAQQKLFLMYNSVCVLSGKGNEESSAAAMHFIYCNPSESEREIFQPGPA